MTPSAGCYLESYCAGGLFYTSYLGQHDHRWELWNPLGAIKPKVVVAHISVLKHVSSLCHSYLKFVIKIIAVSFGLDKGHLNNFSDSLHFLFWSFSCLFFLSCFHCCHICRMEKSSPGPTWVFSLPVIHFSQSSSLWKNSSSSAEMQIPNRYL